MLRTTVVDEGTYCIRIYLSILELYQFCEATSFTKKQMKLDKVWGRGPLGAQSEYFLLFSRRSAEQVSTTVQLNIFDPDLTVLLIL